MTANGQCAFPGCNNSTSNYETVFRKWACPEHDFAKVVWPKLDKKEQQENEYRVEQKIKMDTFNREENEHHQGKRFRPRSGNGKWGRKYF